VELFVTLKDLSGRLVKVMQQTHNPRLVDGFDKAPTIQNNNSEKPTP